MVAHLGNLTGNVRNASEQLSQTDQVVVAVNELDATVQKNIDGGLIGSASLDDNAFFKICNATTKLPVPK